MSITKVEYSALKQVAKKVTWIRRFINKMKLEAIDRIILHGDNKINIALTKKVER